MLRGPASCLFLVLVVNVVLGLGWLKTRTGTTRDQARPGGCTMVKVIANTMLSYTICFALHSSPTMTSVPTRA
jgi:hypothetical protein